MPNPVLQPSSYGHSLDAEPRETPFHRYLSGGNDSGRSLLPPASSELVNTERTVEFTHPHYGPVRATYVCFAYKHYRNRFYSWTLQSATQIDPAAPAPSYYRALIPERSERVRYASENRSLTPKVF